MSSKALQGFKTLPLQFSETSTPHQLFIKEHSVRHQTEDKPEGQTLFVLNVPPYATESSIKRVFSCAGPVKNVIFENKPTLKDTDSQNSEVDKQIVGFKTAYVVYESLSSLQKALKQTKLKPLSTAAHPVLTGLKKWAKEYNDSIYDQSKLQETVNKLVATYDKQVEKDKKQEKQKDDEGWTLVKKKGRNPGMSRKESVENKLLEKNDKNSKRKYLSDFYTFQKKESKMKCIVEARKEFEEVKKKIAAMKQARRFKPY